MRKFSYITFLIILLLNIYLWYIFFNSNENVISPYLSNRFVVYLLFIIFFVYLTIQLYPYSKNDLIVEFNLIIITILFIPIFIISFAYVYREIGLEEASVSFDYVYFSVVTITTLGYGDITPEHDARYFSALQALIGFIFVPLLVSQLINIVRDIRDEVPRQRLTDDPRIKEIIERED